jgi:pre-mRNA-splicing factor SYF1
MTTKRQAFICFSHSFFGQHLSQVAATYVQALETVNPRRATANLHRLYINFARFYEEGGTNGQAEPDLENARKILEKGTNVPFKLVEDLAEVWCEWAEMEIRQGFVMMDYSRALFFIKLIFFWWARNYDEAIRVMQRATAIPKNVKVNYHDHVRKHR